MRWSGHVVRMQDYRVPKRIFYGVLESGHRSRGGKMKRFKNGLKATQKSSGINLETWEADAHDRTKWREICYSGVATFEAERLAKLEDRRYQRKDRTHDPSQLATATFTCRDYGRVCKSRISLYSHQRTHSSLTWDRLKLVRPRTGDSIIPYFIGSILFLVCSEYGTRNRKRLKLMSR